MRENQRITLTKKLLKDSLTSLLKEKDIHKISVRELCEAAGINRSTFYKHYGSQYELFNDIQNDFLSYISDHFVEQFKPDDSYLILQVLTYAEENLDTSRLLINSAADTNFKERLFSLPALRQRAQENLAGSGNERELEYTYRFILNGCYGLLKDWINRDDRESAQEMTTLLIDLAFRLIPSLH